MTVYDVYSVYSLNIHSIEDGFFLCLRLTSIIAGPNDFVQNRCHFIQQINQRNVNKIEFGWWAIYVNVNETGNRCFHLFGKKEVYCRHTHTHTLWYK